MNHSPYVDHNNYSEAHKLFDEYLKKCKFITPDRNDFGDFKVSTITCVSSIAKKVDIKQLFELLQLSNIIVYAKYSDQTKGITEQPAKTSAKKSKNKKNQLFSNQMSIGFKCTIADHVHKNPISVKVFRNGRIQMTGSKNMKEIQTVYEILYGRIKLLLTEHHDIADELLIFKTEAIQIEMINGTFYMNHSLNLERVRHVFSTNYTHEEVFVSQNKKSPLNFCIKSFTVFDKKKCKDKIPSVFIYNTGAINIIATKKDILYKTYDFMKQNLSKYWSQIIQKGIQYPE